MQPIIRWAGSKRQLLPQLRSFWSPKFGRYVEPFCGSACLFFEIQPAAALLGDLNDALVTTYRALKRDAGLVCECLRRLPVGEASFYRIRKRINASDPDAQRAARFLYLNRYCFNGIYRTNSRGEFNVPYGPQESGGRPNYQVITNGAKLLRRATLIAGDFERVLELSEPNDFVYLDPPYAVDSRRVFTEYSCSPFCANDLRRLAKWLTWLNARRVKFVVSYADCREARDLFRRWSIKRVRTRRHIAGFVGARRHAYELIATNIKETANAK